MAKRLGVLAERCSNCGHEWRDHVGASYDATSFGACDDCVYERDHEGRTELCALHAPGEAVRDIRQAFVIDVAPGTAGWADVFAHARRRAAGVMLDIPESEEWPPDAREAAATLRRRAGIPAPAAADHTTVRTLAVDNEVWAAFMQLAGRAYDATVLRSLHGWDPILDLNDEGSTVVATLTPDEWKSMTSEIGAERVREITRRRWRIWRSRSERKRPHASTA